MSLFQSPDLQQFPCNVCNVPFTTQKGLQAHMRISTPCRKRVREESYGGVEETINSFGNASLKKLYLQHSKLIQLAKTLIAENLSDSSIVSILKQNDALSEEASDGTIKNLTSLSEQLVSITKPYLGRTKTIIDETSGLDEKVFLRGLNDKSQSELSEMRIQYANRVAVIDFLLAYNEIEIITESVDRILSLKRNFVAGLQDESSSTLFTTSPTVDTIFYSPAPFHGRASASSTLADDKDI